MIFPSYDKLNAWGNKYALATLAAKRAKQLKAGAAPLIETKSRNALTIALEEISAGKITCEVLEIEDIPISDDILPIDIFAIPADMDYELTAEEEKAVYDDDYETDENDEIDEESPIATILDVDSDEPLDLDATITTIDSLDDEPKKKRTRKKAVEAIEEDIIDIDLPENIDDDIGDVDADEDEPSEE